MQVLCTFGIKMLIFLSICRFRELQVPQTCIYSKKTKVLIGKSHQTCIYSKKSKVLIGKSHQTCKKIKKIKNFRLYVGLTGIDELVFVFFLLFLSICRFGDF